MAITGYINTNNLQSSLANSFNTLFIYFYF